MWNRGPSVCVFDPHCRNQKPDQQGAPQPPLSRLYSQGFAPPPVSSPTRYDHWTALGNAAGRAPSSNGGDSIPSSLGDGVNPPVARGSLDYDEPPPDYREERYYRHKPRHQPPGFDPPNWHAFIYGPHGAPSTPWGHRPPMSPHGKAPRRDRRRPSNPPQKRVPYHRIMPMQSYGQPPPPHYGGAAASRLHPSSFSHFYPAAQKSLPRTAYLPDPIYETLPLHRSSIKKGRKPYAEIILTVLLLIFAVAVGVAIAVVGLRQDDKDNDQPAVIDEVDISVSIHLDLNYEDEYNDTSSQEFKQLEFTLCNQSVEALGPSVTKSCLLRSARPGSVVCDMEYTFFLTPEFMDKITGDEEVDPVSGLGDILRNFVKTNLVNNPDGDSILAGATTCDDDCSDVVAEETTTTTTTTPAAPEPTTTTTTTEPTTTTTTTTTTEPTTTAPADDPTTTTTTEVPLLVTTTPDTCKAPFQRCVDGSCVFPSCRASNKDMAKDDD